MTVSHSNRDHNDRRMEEASDKELLGMSLSNLSKGGLNPVCTPKLEDIDDQVKHVLNVSSRSVLSTYLRWLELHRTKESKSTMHWPNTLLHWGQALKNRGFGEEELIEEVDKWKKEHGPFRSYDRRYPPMPNDIAKAFATAATPPKESQKADKSKGDWRAAVKPAFGMNFEGAPHKSYRCNRCGKGGHHLQVCPTNMDPSYDKPPGNDYTCTICQATGKHFKSICPKNTDPFSINQKRKAAGIAESQVMEVEKIDDMGARMDRGESVDLDEMMSGLFPDNQQASKGGKRGRASAGSKDRTMVKRMRIEDDSDGDDWPGDMVIREERGDRGFEAVPHTQIPGSTVEKYDPFIYRLMQRYGDRMTEVVNQVRRRPTAVDMWERDDKNNMDGGTESDPDMLSPWNGSSAQSDSYESSYSPMEAFETGRLTPYTQDS